MRSHSQTLEAIHAFVERWKDRGYEKGESQLFWTELLHEVLEIERPGDVISFENQVKLASTSFIDAYIAPTKVLIEQKSMDIDLNKAIKQSDGTLLTPFQQAKRYAAELPVSKHPRWVVTCNFQKFHVYDMENPHGEPEEILLENLEKDYYRLRFLVEDGKAHLQRELEVSIKAGDHVGKLYDAFYAQYGNQVTAQDLHALNVLCVRLVFCLYAEDAGIFSKDQFYYYMAQYKPDQMRDALKALFTTLDTPIEKRDRFLHPALKAFPYVNGSLFCQQPHEDIPPFDADMAELLLMKASLGFDWSEISPTIFGAVFESTLNPETRRAGGMHYTSIENIHKVIDPLFFNDLKAEFEQIKAEKQHNKRNQKLEAFQDKLAGLKFLDPACGSGNFLTETYISLRRLENEAISLRLKGQKLLGLEQFNPIKVNIHQFYGIEINDFAVTVAMTALWIAESQMMHETERIIKFDLDYLPLKSFTNIRCGNALRMDWSDLTRPQSGHPLPQGEGSGFAVAHPNVIKLNKIDSAKLELARQFRKEPTAKEAEVWEWLRNRNMLNLKWRRQQIIGGFIADFYCDELRIALEIDGDVHLTEEQMEYDKYRDEVFENKGIKTIRISNESCNYNNIKNILESELTHKGEQSEPNPLSHWERGGRDSGRGEVHFDYIMGNPPFVGARLMNEFQKQDVLNIFGEKYKNVGNLDYVCCWYKKTWEMIKDSHTRAALVSTNSICQGEQVANLWKPLMADGLNIDFAYRTFRWDSEAKQKAHVHCVIVGFYAQNSPDKKHYIIENNKITESHSINAYLMDAPNIFIESRQHPISHVPEIGIGNKPIDGGNYLFEKAEMEAFISLEPKSAQYFHPWYGAQEFIHQKPRYCLWLGDCSPAELRQMPHCLKRVENVRQLRLESKSEGTRKLADKPTRFHVENMPKESYIIVPRVSSEQRKYIPIGYLSSDCITSDSAHIIPDATLYHFGVLTSNVHMAWMRAVCGRLKSDYRYSKDIVYNNFPWPMPNDGQKAKIEAAAQAILDARALYPDCSLADLYDEVTMPAELRKAHQNNDRVVMEAYGFDWRNMSESECVAELFKLYQKLVEVEQSQGEAKPKRARKKS